MLNLYKVAITGALASGKSTVAGIFKNLGAQVYSADAIVHELLTPDTNIGQQVIALFGPDIVENNQIVRSIIAEKAFRDPKLLEGLERITHPAVRDKINAIFIDTEKQGRTGIIIIEIPLLFEAGFTDQFDYTIAVVTDENKAKERYRKDKNDYELRMKRQLSSSEKARRADFIITNNGNIKELSQSVRTIYDNLTRAT